MCDFCEGKEIISKQPELQEGKHTGLSLRIDEESLLLKIRLELGSIGYTLPIKVSFCMFCGDQFAPWSGPSVNLEDDIGFTH